ncbi:MAG TPA: VWA domain-containing protein [Pyrinomonadaceae bacterium]|jgi:VWFA-related protein
MRKALAILLSACVLSAGAAAQTAAPPQRPQPAEDEEVVRISSSLVQTDVVVTDKNDRVVTDLKLDDFEVYDNGRKQELRFMEFVSADSAAPRVEGVRPETPRAENDPALNLTARDVRRIIAFVVDDLTIPMEDMASARAVLADFVDRQMVEGDLVAIVRVVGGVGLLQQFTSDKQLLRRAIAELTPRLHPFSVFNNFANTERPDKPPRPMSEGGSTPDTQTSNKEGFNIPELESDVSLDGYTRGARALTSLSVTGGVVDSMRPLPGRKSLVLISGGLPVFETTQSSVSVNGYPVPVQEARVLTTNVDYLLNQLTDKAGRAGVVINSLDVRGLKASRGVSSFTDPGNEAKSGLMSSVTDNSATFGRTPNMAQFDNRNFDTLTAHQGLAALAEATGGVAVVNTNNFAEGLRRVMDRSSYYLLAYKPSEAFDGKFHRLQVKVRRPGAKVHTRVGYLATPDAPPEGTLSKEQAIARAVMSPLAKRDVDVSTAFQYRFLPDNRAAVDVDLLLDANTLGFKQGADGRHRASLDIVGFVVNQVGKVQQGFSETVNFALTADEHRRALAGGVGYTGRVELSPGNYMLRVAVREAETGRLGSLSKYLEIPDMSKKRLVMSSVFLHAVDPAAGAKAQPVALTALRQVPRKSDLRFSAVVYNPKLDKGSPKLTTQLVISRGERVVFQGPVQSIEVKAGDAQFIKVGQIGVSKLSQGRHVLTFIVTDELADKKSGRLVRSIDFNVVD